MKMGLYTDEETEQEYDESTEPNYDEHMAEWELFVAGEMAYDDYERN